MEQVQKRVNALRNIQLKLADAESKLYDEISQLETKYQSVFEPIYAEREQIVNGEREPTEEEANWPYPEETEDDGEVNGNAAKKLKTENGSSDAKGLPGFWLTCLKATSLLGGMIQHHDEAILKNLRDIKVRLNTQKPYGYTLEFHFNENEYFKNKVLTKSYELTTERDEKNPLSNDTTRLYKCVGSKIEWNDGKNVTLKVTKKKQTNKSSGESKEVTKEEKQGSFFDLFDTHTEDGVKPSLKPAKADANEDELDEEDELEHLFDLDFEIGQFIKDVLVPKALLYYTGDLSEGLDSMDEDDDDDDDEDDEESDGEESKN